MSTKNLSKLKIFHQQGNNKDLLAVGITV